LVYWAALYKEDLKELNDFEDEDYKFYLFWHKTLSHILPFVSSVIHAWLSRAVYIPGHSIYMITMGVLYLFTNYYGTLLRGKPLYFFMTWNDYTTIIIGLIIFVFGAGVQQLICYVIIKTKKRPIDYKIEGEKVKKDQ
jgi:hypothetical protein